jgi:UDP-N-acetylmuramyl pentapeptide phosphotransferase/UDP-N-acetylglucosamine-1-phosphate transferase/O-antigen ligase
MPQLDPNLLQPSVVSAAAFLVAFLGCIGLVLTTRWHGRLSLDTNIGLQKFHSTPTPRVGGLATLAGLVAGYGVAPEPVRQLLGLLLVASVPALFFGLLEDLTKRVGVLDRLLATIFSGFLAWYLSGFALTRTGVPGLDYLLSFPVVSVIFTAVAVAGVANSVNIIDGFNGLAGGVLFIMFVAIGVMAARVGDHALAGTCWGLAGCSLGFTVVNWPFGKIFLGDGGAYQLGFALGWVAVMLVVRNPSIPAWAPLLVCAYPVLEVAFSIVRKTRREGYSPGQPDRVHLHMLVYRRVVGPALPSLSPTLRNGLTSPFAWLYTAALAAWALVFVQQTVYLIAGLVAAAVAYAIVYRRLTRFRWWPAPTGASPAHVAPTSRRQKTAANSSVDTLRAVASIERRPVPVANASNRIPHIPHVPPPAADWNALPLTGDTPSVSRFAVLGYALLGLSTCLTMYEPAPFELIALPLIMASWVRHVLSGARPYTPSSAALVLLLALFSLMQVLPVLGAARSVLDAAKYAAITALLIMIGIHLGRLFGTGDVRFRAFVYGYCVVALLSAGLAVGSLKFVETQVLPEWMFYAGRPKAFFKDPNVLGPYLVPAVLAFLYKVTHERAIVGRLFWLGCALLCALGVVATASRGAWVNMAIAVAVYALMGRTKTTILVLVAATAALAILLMGAAGALSTTAPELLELFTGRTQLQPYDMDRFLKAREAWALGWRYPLGVGPGDITYYMGLEGVAPHNTYARIWAENGPVALVLFLLIVAVACVCAFGAWFRSSEGAAGAVAIALALLVGVLVNAAVVDALHWRHFWVIVGLCVFSSHVWRTR